MKFGEIIQVNAVVIAGILILAGISSIVKAKYFLFFFGETWTFIMLSIVSSIMGIFIEEHIIEGKQEQFFLKFLKGVSLFSFVTALLFLFASMGGIS